MNDTPTRRVVILGGGSAGWLTAGSLAAEYVKSAGSSLHITLIESPDVKPIGVGEGTWPSMRNTLEHMGIKEHDFIKACGASFKQGSKFVGWRNGASEDVYYHPFVIPEGYTQTDLYSAWKKASTDLSFADFVSPQSYICDQHCAPKQKATPQWAGVLNYGYHLDAAKFAILLHSHCTKNLGVNYIQDHVVSVKSAANGDIEALQTRENGDLEADLFIDCSGIKSVLLSQHYKIPFFRQDHVLFNDSAIATHVQYPEENTVIASATISTAQKFGWIWDIGLPDRRGLGHTYSSKYVEDKTVEQTLRQYASASIGAKAAEKLSLKKISFTPGYYQKFWHKNCLAIGLSAGFIEPLEASALAMVELSCSMLREEFPASREHMDLLAERFNTRFTYRWERVIEFLKLHYVLSERSDSDYWIDNKANNSIPTRLQTLLKVWKYQSPSRHDFIQNEEVFPSASYQYVLYGMGFNTTRKLTQASFDKSSLADQLYAQNSQKKEQYKQGLPTNRELISHICATHQEQNTRYLI
jgi:hypothetical protein